MLILISICSLLVMTSLMCHFFFLEKSPRLASPGFGLFLILLLGSLWQQALELAGYWLTNVSLITLLLSYLGLGIMGLGLVVVLDFLYGAISNQAIIDQPAQEGWEGH